MGFESYNRNRVYSHPHWGPISILPPMDATVSKAPSTVLLTLSKRLARESLVGPQDTSLQLLLESSGRERPRCSAEQAVQFLPGAKCGGLLTIPWGCGGSRGGPSSRSPSALAAISCLCFSSLSSYLCFESSKSGSSKRNKVIKLVDITDIQKVGAHPSHHSPSLGWTGLRMIPRLGEMLSRDVLGAAATNVAPCLLEVSMQSPVNFLLRELCTLGHGAASLLPQSWESAAGPDTVTHTEKGNSEVCLTNCAPQPLAGKRISCCPG